MRRQSVCVLAFLVTGFLASVTTAKASSKIRAVTSINGSREAQEPDQTENADAAMLRKTIDVLEVMTEAERQQVLPWLLNEIAQQPDPQKEGELDQALRGMLLKLAREAGQPEGTLYQLKALPIEESPSSVHERESFEALLQEQQKPAPLEDDIRQQIDALTPDPKQPGIALTQAMDLAGVIDHVDDQQTQAMLRSLLQDKIAAMQAIP